MAKNAAQPELPDYNGEHVSRTSVKFTGAGTGYNGLDVKPLVMDLDDEMYLVMRVRAAESPSHFRDKNDLLVRMQRLHIEEMAPVSDGVAVKALQTHAREVDELKKSLAGQEPLPTADEDAAADRERRDETDSPSEIAGAAAERAKRGRQP